MTGLEYVPLAFAIFAFVATVLLAIEMPDLQTGSLVVASLALVILLLTNEF